MNANTAQFKVLLLAAAIAVGYLATAAVRAVIGSDELPVIKHVATAEAQVSPEELLARGVAGIDLPPEVRTRMLGQPPAKARSGLDPSVPNPFAFAIGEHLDEQVKDMKEGLLHNPDLQKQEDGVTPESLDAMAREGRMSW